MDGISDQRLMTVHSQLPAVPGGRGRAISRQDFDLPHRLGQSLRESKGGGYEHNARRRHLLELAGARAVAVLDRVDSAPNREFDGVGNGCVAGDLEAEPMCLLDECSSSASDSSTTLRPPLIATLISVAPRCACLRTAQSHLLCSVCLEATPVIDEPCPPGAQRMRFAVSIAGPVIHPLATARPSAIAMSSKPPTSRTVVTPDPAMP